MPLHSLQVKRTIGCTTVRWGFPHPQGGRGTAGPAPPPSPAAWPQPGGMVPEHSLQRGSSFPYSP